MLQDEYHLKILHHYKKFPVNFHIDDERGPTSRTSPALSLFPFVLRSNQHIQYEIHRLDQLILHLGRISEYQWLWRWISWYATDRLRSTVIESFTTYDIPGENARHKINIKEEKFHHQSKSINNLLFFFSFISFLIRLVKISLMSLNDVIENTQYPSIK